MNHGESNREVEVPIDRRRLPYRLRRAGDLATPPVPRIPRITRLMALAIKFDEMIRRGEVRDYADLARLGHVSRARITQIMNLLNLAPDVQVALLFPREEVHSRPILCEHRIRRATHSPFWEHQVAALSALRPS